MDTPAEMPEAELQRARDLVKTLTDGSNELGLRPKQAQIGITETGETAIVMNFTVDG